MSYLLPVVSSLAEINRRASDVLSYCHYRSISDPESVKGRSSWGGIKLLVQASNYWKATTGKQQQLIPILPALAPAVLRNFFLNPQYKVLHLVFYNVITETQIRKLRCFDLVCFYTSTFRF